ncbi:MAG TPA: FGGY-family carbohydrate kinase [Acidimicrobiales bacterium]|nr:FGGY-family carbohydrate kinase [Acidimicrobiales bacterium]
MSESILVVDVGTSGVRGAVVRPDATVTAVHHREVLPSTPAPGLVEFDAAAMATAALEVAAAALAEGGPVAAVGIANQRASAIAWDRRTGEPVAPGIGWQDLRTVGTCLVLQGEGLRFAPNESATKFAQLLDDNDADRSRDLCLGTVDTWIAWKLSEGGVHATDISNAAVTGLLDHEVTWDWDQAKLDALRIPAVSLPRLVDSSGTFGQASALEGAPPLAALAGDQQASLVGQGCVRPGLTKITFGTGAMLDMCLGDERPAFPRQGKAGCFPIVAWRQGGQVVWGVEGIALAAGTNVEWLRDDLGVISSSADSHTVAAQCEDSDGVMFVPALLGFGTPRWDYGARGTLLGVTRGTGRPQLVRAVLEGVAHTGADLVDAAEADTGRSIDVLRIDGGMSDNPTFVQALADAAQRPVELSPEREATTRGAAFLAGLATGTWSGWDDIAATWTPRAVVEPVRRLDRNRWRDACDRAAGWFPELSAITF